VVEDSDSMTNVAARSSSEGFSTASGMPWGRRLVPRDRPHGIPSKHEGRGWERMKGLVFIGQTGKFTWRMGAAVLAGQSIAVFLGALTARGIGASTGDAASGSYLWVGSGLAVLCIVAAGLMRRPYGVTLGWLIEAATLLSALVVPAMLVVGIIFTALWVTCLVQGSRIDTMQARWAVEQEPAPGTPARQEAVDPTTPGRTGTGPPDRTDTGPPEGTATGPESAT